MYMGEDLLTAEQVALLLSQNVVQYFSIPTFFIHHRDLRLTSNFWQYSWKLLGPGTIGIPAHHPQADGQTECMNYTIGQIHYAYLLYKDQEYWPNHMAVTEMAINSTITASIQKALFEVLQGKNNPLAIDFLLFRESSINPHAHKFTCKIK